MATIITNKFRINNVEQFVESFSEAIATTYYLFIGRSHSWATDADVQQTTQLTREQTLLHLHQMMI